MSFEGQTKILWKACQNYLCEEREMSMSIWDFEKPLVAMMLSHDHIAALEQQIKDLAAHLLEIKQLVTPMMEFKRREWVGLTDFELGSLTVFEGLHHIETPLLAEFIKAIEAKLKEKNGG